MLLFTLLLDLFFFSTFIIRSAAIIAILVNLRLIFTFMIFRIRSIFIAWILRTNFARSNVTVIIFRLMFSNTLLNSFIYFFIILIVDSMVPSVWFIFLSIFTILFLFSFICVNWIISVAILNLRMLVIVHGLIWAFSSAIRLILLNLFLSVLLAYII